MTGPAPPPGPAARPSVRTPREAEAALTFDEYVARDGLGLAALVRSGEVRAADLLETALAAVERLNPFLNAVVRSMEEEARRQLARGLPEGPFAGVPFLLKDLVSMYAGVPTTSGSRLLRDRVPDHDSEMVRRYRKAGVVVIGKSNTPEFGLTPFTEPELFGPARNPWDLSRTPGGSSGGAAAAVAAGMVPLAGGGDGAGSLRIPASCCGIFGLKPSRGRTPTGPDRGDLLRGSTVEHVLTRSVRDSAAMLDAVAGPDVGAPRYAPPPPGPFLDEVGRDPGALKMAFTERPLLGTEVHEDCRIALRDGVALMEALGHHVEEAAPEVEREPFCRAFLALVCAELAAEIAEAENQVGRRARYADVEPVTWALALLGRRMSAVRYASDLRYLEWSARRVAAFFERYDVLLTPTLAAPPVSIGELLPLPPQMLAIRVLGRLNAARILERAGTLEKAADGAFEFLPWLPIFNVTGQPAMSVPLAWNAAGLPIGMHFAARFGEEATLFRLAAQLEEARPWFHRRPPGAG